MSSYTVFNAGNKVTVNISSTMGVPSSVEDAAIWELVRNLEGYWSENYYLEVRKVDNYYVLTEPTE